MLKVYHQYSQIIDFKNLPSPEGVWTLQDVVGEGTYGEVYLAKNNDTGQEVAVKILESIHEVVEEIEEEYLVFRDLSHHPNIPDFFGLYLKTVDLGEDQLWMVMELCGGGSVTDLSRTLRKDGSKLEENIIAYILHETLVALKYLHNNNVMHRDVKGNNILLTTAGQVKLLDFGVSGHLEEKLGRRKTHVGTPYWMAPEVIACENQLEYNYDVRCDIWSLGVTAIELADGHPPLSDFDPRRALFKIPRNPPPTVKTTTEWSENFLDFIKTCLVKDFEKRPFAEDLLQHKFITQLTEEDIPSIKAKLSEYTSKMERTINAPDVTTKHGQFKSGRKAQKDVKISSDLAKLENLDEETIVSQILSRYIQDQVYTYIGDILLALNPFTPISIYTDEYSKMYMNASKDDNPPHIFAVADQSYQQMMHNKHNQCIVISGESGAGKTESANLLVQQLTQLGKAPNRTLEERILQVNPLMEAFGNAKTVINDNSSRFGKYLEMFFTPTGTVIGARITEYLLEKSRVIYQAKGEENFHIFYYIHDGLVSEDNSDSYFLDDSKHYRYINEHTNKPPDISSLSVNRVKFKAIQHCFSIIGFQSEEVNDVYSILAAILHIGNIVFTGKELNGEDQCIIEDDKLIVIVSKLLGIDKGELKETLTTTGMVAKGEIIIRNNSVQEAVNTRDAMAKALYGRLFSWIVNRISSLLKPGKSQNDDNDGLVVGLLDIFGFENFEKNSFEQVCINIANEQIQYYFNQHIFAWEMQEYSNEGIDGSEINYVDNRDILDMFLIKPLGLLALLDEESHFPKATDQTLVEKFHHNIKSSVYSRPKADNLTFCIDHYAGRVEYDATGFLEKNRDRLSVEVVNILRTADNSVVKSLFLTPLSKTGNLQYGSVSSSQSSSRSSTLPSPIGNGGIMVQSLNSRNTTSLGGSRIYSALHASGTASMTRIQQTVATYFRYSLMDLLAKMVTGSPHFVRCLKPNDEKDPGHFDSVKVLTQLRYTGVLETTKIRRQGYSHRVVFSDFIKRYHMLGFSWNENPSGNKESCKILLERLGLENWALGKTKVFLKYYHTEQLTRMFEDRNHKIVSIQSSVRTFLARNRFYKLRWSREKAALQIQTCFRGHKERKKFLKESNRRSNAALDVQKVFRGYMVRKEIQPQIAHRRQASIAIQSAFRGHMVRKQAKKSKINEDDSARKIQKMFRYHRARVTAKQLRNEVQRKEHKAAKLIQTYFRMWRCKTIYEQLLDYKSKKEIELIYFGQQVEMYGKEIYDELKANKDKSPNTTSLTDLLVTRPTVVDSVHPNNSVVNPVTKNDIGIQRMEQIERMNETKQIIPTAENSYYKQVNISKPEDNTNNAQDNSNLDNRTKEEKRVATEEKQVATEEKQVATEEKQVATEGDTDNVSRKHSSSQTTEQAINGKEIMDVENKEYYENIAQENLDRNLISLCKKLVKGNVTNLMSEEHESYYQKVVQMAALTRNFQQKGKEEPKKVSESQDSGKGSPALSRAFLAQSAAKSFIANKPKDLLEPLVLGKSESYSNLPWDAPLQNARQTALSVGSLNDDERAGGSNSLNAPVKPASRISINDDEDSMTERNGVVDEVDKYDLAHRLEEEVAGSIIALWQRNLPSGDYVLPEVNYDEDDEAFEDDNNLSVSPAASRSPLQSISQKPHQSKQPPTLGLGGLRIEIIENSAKPNHNVKVNDNQTNIPIKMKSSDIKQSPQNTVPSPNTSMSPPPVKDSSTSNGLHVVEDDVLINLRSKLRKTKFNYESDASATKKPVEQPSSFVDFRSVLKKGRFSGQWE